jgi:hypothetical protein
MPGSRVRKSSSTAASETDRRTGYLRTNSGFRQTVLLPRSDPLCRNDVRSSNRSRAQIPGFSVRQSGIPKNEKRSAYEAEAGPEVIPGQTLTHVDHRESREDDHGDDLLGDDLLHHFQLAEQVVRDTDPGGPRTRQDAREIGLY